MTSVLLSRCIGHKYFAIHTTKTNIQENLREDWRAHCKSRQSQSIKPKLMKVILVLCIIIPLVADGIEQPES